MDSPRAGIHGSAEAQYALGVMYAKGQGVPQDLVEASRWYFKAANQGHSKAQYNLGLMYAKGRAVPQDDEAAANWFRKAAERGDPRARYNFGVLFVNGRGVERDYAQAYVWLSQAALPDDPEIASQSAEGLAVVLEAMPALEKDAAQQLSAAYPHPSHPASHD